MSKARLIRLLLATVSALLFHNALSLTPQAALAWLAPIPLLVAVCSATGREARYLTWAALAVALSTNFAYFQVTTGPVATWILLGLQLMQWSFLILRTRSALLRHSGLAAAFTFPVLVAAFDACIVTLSPHGTWGSYAYTQSAFLSAIQIASLFGTPGVVFIPALFASTVALAVVRGMRISRPVLTYSLCFALITASVGFGAVRSRNRRGEPVKVGIGSIDSRIVPSSDPFQDPIWRAYVRMVEQLTQAGAKVVVLPEKICLVDLQQSAILQQHLSELTRRTKANLLIGIQQNSPTRNQNLALLFDSSGSMRDVYQKEHMVPYLESDLQPGTDLKTVSLSGFRFGIAICRDLLFPSFAQRYAQASVSALLVPAWDFERDAAMASDVAALSGVANGYAVVRAGREGLLSVTDRYGRQLGREQSSGLPGSMLLADLIVERPNPTFFARFGKGLVLLPIAGAIVLLMKSSRGEYPVLKRPD